MFSVNCPQVDVTTPRWWLINIGWGDDLVPLGTKHYLSQCWPSSMSPYAVTKLQWFLCPTSHRRVVNIIVDNTCIFCRLSIQLSNICTHKKAGCRYLHFHHNTAICMAPTRLISPVKSYLGNTLFRCTTMKTTNAVTGYLLCSAVTPP